MASQIQNAIRNGILEAGRVHEALGIRDSIGETGHPVDVFEAMHALQLAVLIQPLDRLLGAFIRDPIPGALVTANRPLSVQRFTAAHELGHFYMKHVPSLDNENILRRTMFQDNDRSELQEVEANAFAVGFLMPRWLIQWHCLRHGWNTNTLQQPHVVYQLALRLNVSYSALCWTLFRYEYISRTVATRLSEIELKALKQNLLGDFVPQDYRGDVWQLDENDQKISLCGSRNDFFVIKVRENSQGGYVWSFDELENLGFDLIADDRIAATTEAIGSSSQRSVITTPNPDKRGELRISERRPWAPEEQLNELQLSFDLTGPENKGMSRYERELSLVAA